jgi:glucose-1-phosphate thymidylyltransferase
MKALILSGGKGKRLRPITFTIPKQLVPVANKPILYYVIEHIIEAGIREIGIVIAPETGEEIKKAVLEGNFQAEIEFILQDEPKGLAHAVKVAKNYLKDEDFVMYLGDNLLGEGIVDIVERFKKGDIDSLILLKEVEDPSSFGVAVLDKNKKVIKLIEKPKERISNLALVGVYLFNSKIFSAIEKIKPSFRGELEITDAISELLNSGANIECKILSSWWLDTGKKDDLLSANTIVLDEYIKREIRGIIENSEVTGRVKVEENSKIINSKVRGPAVIGSETIVENSFVGPYTSIGKNSKIFNSAIEHSVILENVEISCIDRLEDSLIGRDAKVAKCKDKHTAMRLLLSDESQVEV